MANIYDMTDTWNDAGTTFTAIKMNVTDTNSAADSLLMDLQVGGSSKFSVRKGGIPVIPQSSAYAFAVSGAYSVGLYSLANYTASITMASGVPGDTPSAYKGFEFELTGPTLSMGLTALDVKITRDAANTLAQRNGANAQTFNIYNTYTDGSNYERGFLKWNSNVLEIGTEAAGTGSNRDIRLKVGATTALTVNSGATIAPAFEVGQGGVASLGYGVNGNSATGLRWPASGRAILFSNQNGGEGNVTINAYNSGFGLDENGNILSARYSSTLNTIALGISTQLSWVDASNSRTGSPDVGIERTASAKLKITDGATGTGELIFIVPTSDPGITGALWNNGGTLAISA